MNGDSPSMVELLAAEHGWIEAVQGTSPAAGAQYTYTEEAPFLGRLVAVMFTLVTDANAASRGVSVDYIGAGGVTFCRNGTQYLVTASTTARFCFTASRGLGEASTNNDVFGPLQALTLEPSQQVKISVANIQVTDQLSAIVFTWQRFPSSPHSLRDVAVERLRAG